MPRKSLQVESYAFGPAETVLPASPRKRAIPSAAKAIRSMSVGFIGLDHTGRTMASRLLKAGHQLTVYDPSGEIPETLASAGATAASSILVACGSADAVFTMLPDDEAAEAIILGPGGVLESLPRKAIHIGSSTVTIDCSDRIVEAHWDAGKQYVSAPLLVRSDAIAEAQLAVIAGGHVSTIIEIEPLLSSIGGLTQLSGWPSDANFVQLGADRESATVFQFLARHPELCPLRNQSQFDGPASSVAPFLDSEIKGVLQ